MKLEFFQEIKDNFDNKVENFINELSEHLNDSKEKEISNDEQSTRLNSLREEDCLYYVIDSNLNEVYLRNLNNNISFNETNLPQEIKCQVFTDCFLRYKNGEYIWEKDLTEKFWDTLVSPSELEKIKENFIQESKIQENDPNTNYNVLSHEDDYTILSYDNGMKTIKVPNALMPFGVDDKKVYIYKNEKFELNVDATRKNKGNY